MRKLILFLTLLIATLSAKTQNEPKIGSEKGVKEKLIRIKNGLPDMKKTLTKRNAMWTDQYDVKFSMGNGIVLFQEDENGDQIMTIRYNKSYFSGSITDYQNYYRTLVGLAKEVFGSAYSSDSTNREKKWETSFFQKGKDVLHSPIQINITCSWMFDDLGPDIVIDIYSQLKDHPKEEEDDGGL